MTTYDEGVRRLRDDLPEKWQLWVDRSHWCRCAVVWTARGLHDQNCRWASAIDVIWEAQAQGMLDPDPEPVRACGPYCGCNDTEEQL